MKIKKISLLFLLFTLFLVCSCMPKTGGKITKYKVTKVEGHVKKTEEKKLNPLEIEKQLYTSMQASNYREIVYDRIKNNSGDNKQIKIDFNTIETNESKDKIADNIKLINANLKYRRSSLYTLMLYDSLDKYHFFYRYSFGKAQIPHKFNDHNIGPFLIDSQEINVDRAKKIESYLNENDVAKQLVARWFNRDKNGLFNMDLVAKRGEYNASEIDIKIALSSSRGRALLKDAGEELIGNTFIVIYDFSSESTGNSAMTGLPTICFNLKAYLYRLVWDDKTASIFYNDYWVDKTNSNLSKIHAFDKSNIFKLKFVGSSIIKSKNIHYLYTVPNVLEKLIDNSMADLQRNYEEFRVKSPLYSSDPIAAKIGKKEGVKEGDKYEVLEQILNSDGTTKYQKIGEIRVNREKDIWDNTAVGDWFGKSETDYTIFSGKSGTYFPGMLIRQIN
jgi:hypothetical protein